MGRRCFQLVCACALLTVSTAAAYGQSAGETAKARQVARSIKESGQLANYRLGVKYQDGVAWLLGTVTSEEQLQTAIGLAEQVDGVDQVISKLTVVAQPATAQEEPAPASVQPATAEANAASLLPTDLDDEQSAAQASQASVENAVIRTPVRRGPVRRAPQRQARPLPMPSHQAAAIRAAGTQRRAMPAGYNCECDTRYMGGMSQGGMPQGGMSQGGMGPQPTGHVPGGGGGAGVSYDNAHMPGYAWPSYAAYPNYSAVTYPKQYSPSAWPYIGPFYPYPQVPLGWRKVCLEWDDGWWQLDFSHCKTQ